MSDVRLERVPIEFRGIAPGLEITGEVGHTVSVRLRGPRDVVRGLMPNQVAVVADLSGKEPGDRIIQLTPSDVSKPSRIEVLRVDPATIRLNIEPSARRSVTVITKLGKVPDDYQVTKSISTRLRFKSKDPNRKLIS
jgi:YbbR domain-containing protein